MNLLHIIGNLTADPELRTTTTGKEVCSFDVAVNRRRTSNNPDPGADYFRVSAWEEKGKLCKQYLKKGNKVSIVGSVSVRAYTNSKGEARGSMEVTANEVEFLSPKGDKTDPQTGMQKVEDDDMPY